MLTEEESRHTRGHTKKVGKSQCSRYVKMYSFPHRIMDVWNVLREEIVEAARIHAFKEKFKEMLDK